MDEQEQGRIRQQFSIKSIWDRVLRVIAVGLGAVVALQHIPNTSMEWVGVAVAVVGASYTGK